MNATIERQRVEAGINDLARRWSEAVGQLADSSQPPWQRTTEAMQCFKGLKLSDLPPRMSQRIESQFLAINRVLSGYSIQTWEDYRQVSSEDLTRIQNLLLEI